MNTAQSSEARALAAPEAHSKREHVRQVFEDAAHYLVSRRVDIRFRKDTVRAFAESIPRGSLLDVGCGDGSISLQLLDSGTQLTLMDLSTAMVARAKANVPEAFAANVTVRNDDFLAADFADKRFDLIVTVGVMAHVDSPDAFLAKLKSLLRPGGSLIVEFTDSQHPVGRIGRFWGALKESFALAKYQTNKLSFAHVAPLFERHGLRLVSAFRYARLPLPAIDRVLSEEAHYRISRRIFGQASHNTNAALGNEYICLLTAETPA